MKAKAHGPRWAMVGLAAILAIFAAVAAANAQEYTAIDIGQLSGAYTNYYPTGINNSGTVVGYAQGDQGAIEAAFVYSNGVMVPLGGGTAIANAINDSGTIVGDVFNQDPEVVFSYSGGVMTNLGSLGGSYGYPNAINNYGTVVGWSMIDGNQFFHAFSYFGGVMTDLGTLGGSTSVALGINNNGTIVGGALTASGEQNAFSYKNGMMSDLGTLGGLTSAANGINSAGTIVGDADVAGGNQHAFRFSNGVMQDLGTLGGATSSASAINIAGIVVGNSTTADGASDAFIYENGTMYDLNKLMGLNGVTLTDATALNDLGQIVADGSDGNAYLLTPIPELPTYAATLGAAALGFAVIRKRKIVPWAFPL